MTNGRRSSLLSLVGPGLAIAATGVGAGDLLAAMIAGADFGLVVAWVIVIGAVFKFALNEGLARWQIGTDTSLIQGWNRHLWKPLQIYFLIYLLVWSFIVAAGLMSACGIAAHALAPAIDIRSLAIVHSLAALTLVGLGRYELFERIMKALIVLMVITLVTCVVLIRPDASQLLGGLFIPRIPSHSAATILSLMGGVGGSVTLLSYGYWIREKGWTDRDRISAIRIDLLVGYALTAIFGLAVLILATTALSGSGGMPTGSKGLVVCAEAVARVTGEQLGDGAGVVSGKLFLIGVWGAVFTSTLGVWQGVPYLFADFMHGLLGRSGSETSPRSALYRGYLAYLALPPMLLLFLDRPVWVIKLYTLTGGLFMPFLAASLLWLNSRGDLLGSLRNRLTATTVMSLTLVLFAIISLRQILDLFLK